METKDLHSLSKFQIWMMASRPRTLFAAFVPVIVGASLSIAENSFGVVVSLVALFCSILIQIGTNFTNDLYDFIYGADTKKRIGPKRVLNEGLVSKSTMKKAIALTFGLAFLLGLYLVYQAGYMVLIIGIISIIAGLAYTAGPFPLAYNGLGDIFVFLFFGVVGTVGTYFVNTGEFSGIAFLASIPVGALVTNILVVNNYRDIDQDKEFGKITFAVIIGKKGTLFEYIFLLIASFAVPLILYFNYEFTLWIFLPYLTLPFAYKLIIMLFKLDGKQLNKALELTAKFSVLFGLLFSIGFVL